MSTINLKTFFAFAPKPKDTEEIRLEKFAAFLVASSCCLAGCLWSAMYYFVFGWNLTAILPVFFVLIVGASLIISHITKNHHYTIYTQIICIMYIPTLVQWNIGGAFDSGLVLVWAFLGPVCALMFFSIRQAIFWFLLYVVNLLISFILNDFFVSHGQVVAENTKLLFFLMNFGFSSAVFFIFAGYYVMASKRLRDLKLEYLEQVSYVTEAATALETATFDAASLNGVAARTDALGRLARVFQQMARQVQAREERLEQQVQELQIEIDKARQAKKVAEITDSAYFQQLRRQADQLRTMLEETNQQA